jgi:predicted amidohydrolase YtcJ
VAGQTSAEEREGMLQSVFDAYLATGVTGAVDLATVPDDLAALEAYAAKHGRLPIRIACHWLVRPNGTDESRAQQVRDAAAHRDRLAHLAPWLSVAGIKIISDGVVDSCTAFLREPYPNGATPGPIWPGDELQKVITLADSLDLQVACHAIGDAAVDQALDAFEAAIAANGPREQRRHRIEHLEVVGADAIPRLARLGVVASLQPVHADPVKVVNWDAQLAHGCRCDRKFPWKEFEDADADVAFGSDAPTAPYHPLPNMYTATTRLSAINPSLPDPTDERTKNLARLCVSLETAVRYYTAGGAYSMRADKEVGTLEPGKSADFAVLDIDPFDGRLDSLRKAQQGVAQTWVAGERVFAKGA